MALLRGSCASGLGTTFILVFSLFMGVTSSGWAKTAVPGEQRVEPLRRETLIVGDNTDFLCINQSGSQAARYSDEAALRCFCTASSVESGVLIKGGLVGGGVIPGLQSKFCNLSFILSKRRKETGSSYDYSISIDSGNQRFEHPLTLSSGDISPILSSGAGSEKGPFTFALDAEAIDPYRAPSIAKTIAEDRLAYINKRLAFSSEPEVETEEFSCRFDEFLLPGFCQEEGGCRSFRLVCETEHRISYLLNPDLEDRDLYPDAKGGGCLVETTKGLVVIEGADGELQLPGGLRRAGESVDQAAARETKEELGAPVTIDSLIEDRSDPLEAGLFYLFKCSLEKPFDEGESLHPADGSEVKAVHFFNKETMGDLAMGEWRFPWDLGCLERALNGLGCAKSTSSKFEP